MANHTGDAIDAVLAHFADLQISDKWRFNGQTFVERVEGYVLSAIESLEEELDCTEDSNEMSGSDSVAPADGGDERITDEDFLQALEAIEGQEDARRDGAMKEAVSATSADMKRLQSLLLQAMKQDLLGVEIVDENPIDESGAPRTHFASNLRVSHLAFHSNKVYVGAIHEDYDK